MASYAVLWCDTVGGVEVGKLELDDDRVRLEGARRQEVSYGEIESLHIGRLSVERLLGRPTLVLGLAGAGLLRISSLDGLGALTELAEKLGRLKR
jgi:hypothetical protein